MIREAEQPILSKPIYDLVLSSIDPQYTTRVQWYLVQVLHCRVSALPYGGYLIIFPEGSREETYEGRSTVWMRRTMLRFPGGEMLPQYGATPLNPTQRNWTMLGFPLPLLEGPEPTMDKQQASNCEPLPH